MVGSQLENVLMQQRNGQFVIKITDFGLAKDQRTMLGWDSALHNGTDADRRHARAFGRGSRRPLDHPVWDAVLHRARGTACFA